MVAEVVDQKTQTGGVGSGVCLIPVVLLQRWALALSQGDSRVRYEIEKFLQGQGLPVRDPLS